MTASFPWYDLAPVRWANDAIWRATGFGGALDRVTPVEEQWRADDLVVSQACGLDLFLTEAPIEPVLAPVFELDCEEGSYFSYLVGVREGVAAVNSLSSRSGFTALLTACEPSSLVVTGSHEASLAAVREGRADMACIDAVTWHILERDEPSSVAGLSVNGRTCSAPAPPYIVRKGGRAGEVARRVTMAMQDAKTREARRALLLRGVIPVTMDDYAPVLAEYQGSLNGDGPWREGILPSLARQGAFGKCMVSAPDGAPGKAECLPSKRPSQWQGTLPVPCA